MLIQIGLIILLSLLNGFFALSEMAVVASRKSRLKQMARTSSRARVALRLLQHPDRFLSTVQVGITLVVLITGAIAGTSLGGGFAALLRSADLTWLTAHATALGWLIGFVLVTCIQIVIGELVPKRIALVAPEKLACNIAMPMLVLSRICTPFVWALSHISSALLRLLRINRTRRAAVSEEEIRLLIAEGAEAGVLDADERNMVNRVLRLGDRNVGSVMTPRPRIVWLDADAPLADNLAVLREHHFSHYPVYRGDEGDVLGIISVKRMVDSLLDGRPNPFGHITKPLYVPATTRALDLIDSLRDAQVRMALVVDEYGDIEGLATLNDLLGSVIGQAQPRPTDPTAPYRRDHDGSWLIDGALGVDDVCELLHLEHLPNEDEHEFHTLAGMITTALGHIPHEGEAFGWHGLRFEVLDMDGARIDKVRVSTIAPNASDPAAQTTP
ncbi:MAG TPA: hemolysin family protein [Rhodanobacteraceae bacterium]